MALTDADLESLHRHGLSAEDAARQLALFAAPPPPIRLARPCTVGDGIVALPEERRPDLQDRFRDAAHGGRFSKLVPASGAATRMFRSLLAVYRADHLVADEDDTEPASDADREACRRFLEQIDAFPFIHELTRALAARDQASPAELAAAGDAEPILRALFDGEEDGGLGYSALPKALIPFHRYPAGARTALEEHVLEAADHLRSSDGVCVVHFTIPQHREMDFREIFRELAGRLEKRFGGGRYELSCSIQRPSTDTLAVEVSPEGDDGTDGDPVPVRTDDGDLLFRPGGHGALLLNLASLAEQGADLVQIRNIDNVQPDERRREVLLWNRIMGGYLLEIETEMVEHLDRAQRSEYSGDQIDDSLRWVADRLHLREALELLDRPHRVKQAWLIDRLDRPLRVCAMVRNEGEPGGGPFWVLDDEGHESLQIVESAQIDRDDPQQAEIAAAATHFNPVHMVCRLRDHRGNAYDLGTFVDSDTVFLTRKSYHGRPIRVLERPGLWNGAMARWNTIFVEVPSSVFAPVKTVFDLLRPAHRV